MNRNDSPRLTNKLYDICREIICNKSSFDNFPNEFLESLTNDEEPYVYFIINIEC